MLSRTAIRVSLQNIIWCVGWICKTVFEEKEIWNYEFFVKADFLIGAEGMKETMQVIIISLAIVLIIFYLVIRPLSAIGDIPGEIRKLRESIDNLSEIIKNRSDS